MDDRGQAALDDYRRNPWLIRMMARLIEGSPAVTGLLETNPFPGKPPQFVRAMIYDYHFTSAAERKATHAWWKRELKGPYAPVLSRDMIRGSPTEKEPAQ